MRPLADERGMSLIETLIAVGVLTVGAVGLAAAFVGGMQLVTSAPYELVATQKAAEAVESVFGARDSHTIPWEQLRNVSDDGVFLNGPQPMKIAGADGAVNTADDGALEQVVLPGPDQTLGTADDRTEVLSRFTRDIRIVELSPILRSVTVTITYPAGAATKSYVLTAYVSAYV
ncbi:MAG: hypothetical protein AB7Q29_19540 [Vicinamibacterales bacterium]